MFTDIWQDLMIAHQPVTRRSDGDIREERSILEELEEGALREDDLVAALI